MILGVYRPARPAVGCPTSSRTSCRRYYSHYCLSAPETCTIKGLCQHWKDRVRANQLPVISITNCQRWDCTCGTESALNLKIEHKSMSQLCLTSKTLTQQQKVSTLSKPAEAYSAYFNDRKISRFSVKASWSLFSILQWQHMHCEDQLKVADVVRSRICRIKRLKEC